MEEVICGYCPCKLLSLTIDNGTMTGRGYLLVLSLQFFSFTMNYDWKMIFVGTVPANSDSGAKKWGGGVHAPSRKDKALQYITIQRGTG